MSLTVALDAYQKQVALWNDSVKKAGAAVAKLEKAVALGNVRDLDKLRLAAQNAMEIAAQRAQDCGPLEFDVAEYLRDGYWDELKQAAERAGVRLFERDGVLFCYPVLVRAEPELLALRIEKKLEVNLRPELLAQGLKKAQAQEAKSKSERFLEAVFEAYEFLRMRRGLESYIDLPLTEIYRILTLLPGADKDYSLLDFTRDVYFLDVSEIPATKRGFEWKLPASTVSRERSVKLLHFVTRDGQEKQYAAIKFTPPVV